MIQFLILLRDQWIKAHNNRILMSWHICVFEMSQPISLHSVLYEKVIVRCSIEKNILNVHPLLAFKTVEINPEKRYLVNYRRLE